MNSRQVKIWFRSEGPQLSVKIAGSDQESIYTGDTQNVAHLSLLPDTIASDTPIEQVARQYQEFFRGLRGAAPSVLGHNAMERFFSHIGDRGSGTVDLRFESDDSCRWSSGLAWELLLHDPERDELENRLLRIAVVRSTGVTSNYSPRRVDGMLRVLILQGADGPQPLDFAGERSAIQSAWEAIGPKLQAYVASPVIRPAFRDKIASTIIEVQPHLLWFSGHGQAVENGFNLLLGNGQQQDWAPASVFLDALIQAATVTGALPIVVAFWACEAGRAPRPSIDAGNESFPVLVKSIVDAGVEAVIGVQTKIYDTSARVMGTELFSRLAEGFGPAQSLASARSKLLAMPTKRSAPGRSSEWTSPVMWVNGANLPSIEWGRPLEEDEALAFYRLGAESFLLFEGGRDILQEAPDLTAAGEAAAWVREAPVWITCSDLEFVDGDLEVVRQLKNLTLSEKKTVLIVRFKSLYHKTVLDAVADGFRMLQLRAFPKPNNEAWDFLASLFEAFRQRPKEKGWPELLQRSDMIVAVIGDGGIPPSEELADARSAAAALLVFSSRPAEDHKGSPALWDGWHADDFDCDGSIPMTNDEALAGFLTAFAVLNKPLSQGAVAELARDFGLAIDAATMLDGYLSQLGQRYVVKASLARKLLDAVSPDKQRAAHRACMGLLARLKNEFDAPFSQQLIWRVHHSIQGGELQEAIKLASRAIARLADEANHQEIVQLFYSLGATRRHLDVFSNMDVATAFIQVGNPKRAYDLLQQKSVISESSAAERLRFAVIKAEALRNLSEADLRMQSISVLDTAINENASVSVTKEDRQWMLIAEHDLGRNIHYFQRDTLKACTIFRRVVSECGADPDLAYLKTAALRNLADALDRYTYGKVERDPVAAEQHVRDAIEIAKKFPSAGSLLPEMLYVLAKYEYARSPGAAATDIRQAIELARDRGVGLVLTLAKNKWFWWRVGVISGDRPPSAFDLHEWERLEKELDFLAGHAWPMRALVDSRIRAAKCLSLLGQTVQAIEVLLRGRDVLLHNPTLNGDGDWIHRWQPIFAGLAVLSPPKKEGVGPSKIDTWADLRTAALTVGLSKETGTKDPKQVWEAVA